MRPFLIANSLSFALAILSCNRSAIIPPICNMRENHEPVRNAHCNCSESTHLQPVPHLLRHSSPVLSLSQAVEDLYLNRQQSQIHQNSALQTAHYLQQHHSKQTATFAATSAHQKAKAQGQAKAKATESIYSVSTEKMATRVYAILMRY